MSPAVHGGGPRWKSFEYNTLLSVEPFREERIMDANRYFTAMHNAMSSCLPGAQLLAAVRLQDLCGNDAYLEVRRMPGEHCATVCYSTMGRRGLNFQLFRKGWMLCHNESGQLTGQFPAKAESLLEDTDFHACCREDRLVIESTLIAGFSKILAEKLIRLCGADTQEVLAAEQPPQT